MHRDVDEEENSALLLAACDMFLFDGGALLLEKKGQKSISEMHEEELR